MTGGPLRVVVAGDPVLVRTAVRDALAASPDGDVHCTVVDGVDVLVAACRDADLLLCGVEVAGVGLATVLPTVLGSGTRVLVVCPRDRVGTVPELLLAGASGVVVLEDCTGAALRAAARDTMTGRATLHPAVAELVLQQWRAVRSGPPPALTAKEQEVLAAMMGGEPVKTIARGLGLSARTVDSHRARIFVKLGVRSHAQAVQRALDLGLVQP